MDWIKNNVGHLLTAGGVVGGGGVVVIFRDAIGKMWDEFAKARAASRAERAQAHGGGERLAQMLIDVFREEMAEQKASNKLLQEILQRLVAASELTAERQLQFGILQADFEKRMGRMESRLRI